MSKEDILIAGIDGSKNTVIPIGVTALDLFGIQLSEWVYIFTLIYLITHISYIVWKWFNGK